MSVEISDTSRSSTADTEAGSELTRTRSSVNTATYIPDESPQTSSEPVSKPTSLETLRQTLSTRADALKTQHAEKVGLLVFQPDNPNPSLNEISTNDFINQINSLFRQLAAQTSNANKINSYIELVDAAINLMATTPQDDAQSIFAKKLTAFEKNHQHSLGKKIVRVLATMVVGALSLCTMLPRFFKSTWYTGEATVITKQLGKLSSLFAPPATRSAETSETSSLLTKVPIHTTAHTC
ncbi:MAG: hypothetical protein GKR77_02990 [Legionellales bacterium]|nr:hypothetical protein [Legionellales bacterium]